MTLFADYIENLPREQQRITTAVVYRRLKHNPDRAKKTEPRTLLVEGICALVLQADLQLPIETIATVLKRDVTIDDVPGMIEHAERELTRSDELRDLYFRARDDVDAELDELGMRIMVDASGLSLFTEQCAIEDVTKRVARLLDLSVDILRGSKQTTKIVQTRFIAMSIALQMVRNCNHEDIGGYFKRNRTTVYHAIASVSAAVTNNNARSRQVKLRNRTVLVCNSVGIDPQKLVLQI